MFQAVRRWRTCHILTLQVFRRLHQRGITERDRLVHPPTHLLCPLQGTMGSLSFPEQHLNVAEERAGGMHGRHD